MTVLTDDHPHERTIGALIEYISTEVLDSVERLKIQANSMPLGYVDTDETVRLIELVADGVAALAFVVPMQHCGEVDFVDISAEIRASARTIEAALPQ